MDQDHQTNIIWDLIVYIVNGCVTRKNLDDRLHHGYFMGYVATTGVILYCKSY